MVQVCQGDVGDQGLAAAISVGAGPTSHWDWLARRSCHAWVDLCGPVWACVHACGSVQVPQVTPKYLVFPLYFNRFHPIFSRPIMEVDVVIILQIFLPRTPSEQA